MSKEQRRKTMQHIKSKDTTIEIRLRKALWHKGFRYRKNDKKVFGTPDIVFKKAKIAIFCDSEFWHGKNFSKKRFGTNKTYWENKIKRNIEHDLEVTIKLRDDGWVVLRFWEKDIETDVGMCVDIIAQKIRKSLIYRGKDQ